VRSVDRQIRVSSVEGVSAGAGTFSQVSSGTFRWVQGISGDAVNGDRLDMPGTFLIHRVRCKGSRIVSMRLLAAQGVGFHR
jgi:hypothetical protein